MITHSSTVLVDHLRKTNMLVTKRPYILNRRFDRPTSLVVNVPHERATGAALISCPWNNHPDAHSVPCYAMHLVVDELPRGVEFASRLPIDREDVATLDGSSTFDIGCIVAVRHRGRAKTSDEAEFSDRGFGSDAVRAKMSRRTEGRRNALLCSHMNSWVLVPRDIVAKDIHEEVRMLWVIGLLGQCTRRTGDLDVVVTIACSNCRAACAQARANVAPLARILHL